MRVVFAGTPPFAARALESLYGAGHSIGLVLTQPERPAGRGLKRQASAVGQWASDHGLPVLTPATLRDPQTQERLAAERCEVMVVAAYGLILPPAVLAIPPRGCLNIHASLLPRWRGAAPIERALLAGDERTGVCIMRMEAGLDTGPVLLEKSITIGPRDTGGTLTTALAELGARAIVEALDQLDFLVARPQQSSAATYAAKIDKSEARIDWRESAAQIDRQVRAFDPRPGAETSVDGEPLKIRQAQPEGGSGRPGEILDASTGRLLVGCGEGALAITAVQRAGGKRLGVDEFLRGRPIVAGLVLGRVPAGSGN